ncbi:hypothetical protein DFA_06854 [Cavenderia fasciculata]|uniref:Uncharacterized protein n=1 Tax=Cavenderia fasciculata TaxID=261658 RepID=F4PWV1_CACFS|nr:uncharacterized protein DFA_06854 [Cavenderia fasciculata]EGG19754.1 hypothetical protein DFA_06854 [Cavenderia fasciculata]|eukprot:XP_004358100.1 hypothetical protein DFA_06854 [Cavenderia fasciculata]
MTSTSKDSSRGVAAASVFKNRYLLLTILGFTRDYDNVELFGARVPVYQPTQDDIRDKKKYCKRRRYLELVRDLDWVIEQNYYSLLRDILTTRPEEAARFATAKTIQLTQHLVGDTAMITLLLKALPDQFYNYFAPGRDDPTNVPSLGPVASYLQLIAQNGNVDVWNAVITFINKGIASKTISAPPPIPPPRGGGGIAFFQFYTGTVETSDDNHPRFNTILPILFKQKVQMSKDTLDVRNIKVMQLIHQCIKSNQLRMLAHIINMVGVDRVCAFIDDMAINNNNNANPLQVHMLNDTHVAATETLQYISKTLPFKTLCNLFKTPLPMILLTNDHLLITSHLTSFPKPTKSDYFTFLDYLLRNHTTQSSSSSISPVVLTIIINHFLPLVSTLTTCDELVHRVNSTFTTPTKQNNQNKEIVCKYNLSYLIELYFELTNNKDKDKDVHNQKIEDTFQYLVQQHTTHTEPTLNKRCEYLLKRVGFYSICQYGTLEIVKTSFTLLQQTPKDNTNIKFGKQSVNLLSRDVSVLSFCTDIIVANNNKNNNKLTLTFNAKDSSQAIKLAFDNTSGSSGRGRQSWDIIEYLCNIATTIPIFKTIFNIPPELYSVLCQKGLSNLAIALQPNGGNGNGSSGDYSVVVNPPDSSTPAVSQYQSTQDSLYRAQSILQNAQPHNYTSNWNKLFDMATSRQQFLVVKYLVTNPPSTPIIPVISLDAAIQMMNFQYVKDLVESDLVRITLSVVAVETWQCVGTYGSLEWIEKILLKYDPYCTGRQLIPRLQSLRFGAKLNYHHGTQIINELDTNPILKY